MWKVSSGKRLVSGACLGGMGIFLISLSRWHYTPHKEEQGHWWKWVKRQSSDPLAGVRGYCGRVCCVCVVRNVEKQNRAKSEHSEQNGIHLVDEENAATFGRNECKICKNLKGHWHSGEFVTDDFLLQTHLPKSLLLLFPRTGSFVSRIHLEK